MPRCCVFPSPATLAFEKLTVHRASRSFCRSFAGWCSAIIRERNRSASSEASPVLLPKHMNRPWQGFPGSPGFVFETERSPKPSVNESPPSAPRPPTSCPAVPGKTATARASTRSSGSGNNQTVSIRKRGTQSFDPGPGDHFDFLCMPARDRLNPSSQCRYNCFDRRSPMRASRMTGRKLPALLPTVPSTGSTSSPRNQQVTVAWPALGARHAHHPK